MTSLANSDDLPGDQVASDGSPTTPLSVSSVFVMLAARLSFAANTGQEPITIRAVPIRPSSSRRSYAGMVYFELRDPIHTREMIQATIAEDLLELVEWGAEAAVTGLLSLRTQFGKIYPEFRVDSIRQAGGAKIASRAELEERWSDAASRVKRKPVAAFLVERPRIAVITGVTSVAIDDVLSQLAGHEEHFELEVRRVRITEPSEVADAVRSSCGANLIAVIRGGGQDVGALDDDAVIEAVASSPTPTVVALGHATDRLVLDRVADASFPTPTAFGVWMRNTLEQMLAHRRQAEEVRQFGQAKDLQAQLVTQQDASRSLVEQLEKAGRDRRELDARLLTQSKELSDQLEASRNEEKTVRREAERLGQEVVRLEQAAKSGQHREMDAAGNAQFARLPSNSLRHVSRGSCQQTALELVVGQVGNRIRRAPNLERTNRLEILQLQVDVRRGIETVQPNQRGANGRTDDSSASIFNGRR